MTARRSWQGNQPHLPPHAMQCKTLPIHLPAYQGAVNSASIQLHRNTSSCHHSFKRARRREAEADCLYSFREPVEPQKPIHLSRLLRKDHNQSSRIWRLAHSSTILKCGTEGQAEGATQYSSPKQALWRRGPAKLPYAGTAP